MFPKLELFCQVSRVIKQEHFLLDINSFFSPAFSLFNVVTFNNDACTSTSITTQSGARIGQCFTAEGKSFYFHLSSTVLLFLSQCTSLCQSKWLTFSCKTLAATCTALCGYWCACASIVLKCDYIEQTESWKKMS